MRRIARTRAPEASSRAGRAARDGERIGPIDRLILLSPAIFRRRLITAAVLAVVTLAVVTGVLSWRQYQDNRTRAVSDLNARVILVGAVVNSYFSGGVSTAEAIAAAPSVVAHQPELMSAYFKRVSANGAQFFTGGLSWVDLSGQIEASSTAGPAVSVADRVYFKRVLATRTPYISAGLIGRRNKQPVVVTAVPTFDARHRLTGVLVGSIRLSLLSRSTQTQALGFEGLAVIDRDGQLLLSGLARVENQSLLTAIRKRGTGDLANTTGLDGGSHHIVSFAAATLPAWTIAIDRPASSVYAASRRAFVLELASLIAALMVVLSILVQMTRRSRRELEAQGEQARSWSRLARTLAAAATAEDVAEALVDSLRVVFPGSVVVIAFDSERGREVKTSSNLFAATRLDVDEAQLAAVAALGSDGPRTRSLERERSLRELYLAFGRRLRAVHSIPIVDSKGNALGTIVLLTFRLRLQPSEWELLDALEDQAARAFERARASEHDHELALRLQQSLLPHRLPSVPGIGLAGEYLAGGTGIEVGGDWYDAVLRPDGVMQLCVGDVSGRGVVAATIMGRQRNVFHAYAYDYRAPSEILKRMLRHVGDEEMITAAVVTIDPVAGELSYAIAGHPPPLLLDAEDRSVLRLDRAGAPPLGVAEPADIVEVTLPLPERARLAMYTDGLVERRGLNIDVGIDALELAMTASANVIAHEMLGEVATAIGAPNDDVALLVATIDATAAISFELDSDPGELPDVRRRLRAWLGRRGLDDDATAELTLVISEAINNAIEHAYRGGEGVVGVRLSVDSERIVAEISDHGSWRVNEPSDERGRGVMLMESLMDDVQIASSATGTRVRLELRRAALAPAANTAQAS